MGELGQTRLIRKLDLERFLAKLRPNPSPKAHLEQYSLSESTAATMLHLAAYTFNGIVGKRVLDLGCGTGVLALGAAFLGADEVVGVDIDLEALKVASDNSVKAGFQDNVDWVAGDIDVVTGAFDTVVQNPPFGVQRRAADRRFLEKALELGSIVFSLHNHPFADKNLLNRLKAAGGQPLQVAPSSFMTRAVEQQRSKIEAVYALPLILPHMFDFHTKDKQYIIIDLYVMKKPAIAATPNP